MPGFRDYDAKARLALVGGLAATLALFVPWLSVRLSLQRADVSGWGLLVLPATVRTLRGNTAGAEVWLVAAFGAAAVVATIAACLLALAPGLRAGTAWHGRAGLWLTIAALVASLVGIGLFSALVGPGLGAVYFEPGAGLAIVGLLVAVAGWSGVAGSSVQEPAVAHGDHR